MENTQKLKPLHREYFNDQEEAAYYQGLHEGFAAGMLQQRVMIAFMFFVIGLIAYPYFFGA